MSKILRVAISAALLGIFAWRTDWRHIADVVGQMHPGYWFAAVALYLATQVLSGLRWQILSRPLGFQRSLWQYTSFYFIGMYFNLVLPTSVGGDVVRAWYLDARSGQKARAFLSVFLDRLSGLLVLLLLAGVATLFSPVPLSWQMTAAIAGTVAAAVTGFALLPVLLRQRRVQARFGNLGEEVTRSLAQVFRPTVLLLSLYVQAANVVVVWLVGQAIALSVPPLYYAVLVPMVTLMTLLPVSINGLGVREGGTLLFLQPLGIPDGTALALAFLWFSVFTAASLCGGVVYLFGRFPRLEVRSDDGPIRDHSAQGRVRQPAAAA